MKTLKAAALVVLACSTYSLPPDPQTQRARHGWLCGGSGDGKQCQVLSPDTAFTMRPKSGLRYVEFSGERRHVTVKCH